MPQDDMKSEAIRLDDLTRIFNPLSEDFTWAYGGIDYTIPAKDEKLWPRHLCRHIAKHLVDKILQEKHNVSNTMHDTPIRRKILSSILISEAEENPDKVPTVSEAQKSLDKELEKDDSINRAGKEIPKKERTKVEEPTKSE